ncbi:MAG TPA: hypothetical protein VHL98_09280 [Microvirga sp.]|jgi:hypothetical protein|nr:hypothetical protein [Microvirga sp.]
MKTAVTMGAAILAFGLAAEPAAAQGAPGGCLKYGLGGAVAGHFAGGHTLKGALAGCVLGMARRRQYEREVQERRRNEQIARERGRGQTAERRPAPERSPDLQRVDRPPRPLPERLPETQRADRVPAPLPEARPRPDTGPDWVPDMRRVDRAPAPQRIPDATRADRAPAPQRIPDATRADRAPTPEPRSPYEDLGLGRSTPPAPPAPRQEAGRRRAPGDGFETEGTFSHGPVDLGPVDLPPDRRRRPPAFEPEATGSFFRAPGTVY